MTEPKRTKSTAQQYLEESVESLRRLVEWRGVFDGTYDSMGLWDRDKDIVRLASAIKAICEVGHTAKVEQGGYANHGGEAFR